MLANNYPESAIQSILIVNSQITEGKKGNQNDIEMKKTNNLEASQDNLIQNALELNTRFLNINRDLFTVIHELQYKVKKGTEELAKIIGQNIEKLNVENKKLIDIQDQERKEKRIYFFEKDQKEQKISYQDQKQILQMYLYNLQQSIKFDYEVILNQKQSKINLTQNLENLIETEQKSLTSKRIISNYNQNKIESIFPSQVKVTNSEIKDKQEEFKNYQNSKIQQEALNKIIDENQKESQNVIQQQYFNENVMFVNEGQSQQQQEMLIDNIVYSQKEEKFMKCFAFNENSSELFMCLKEIIKCFKFNQGKIAELFQELFGHKKQIKSLIYIKKTCQLVSGSAENKVIVWQKNNVSQKWCIEQTLSYEHNPLKCLNGNENQDLLISGGNSRLNIWKLEQNKWIADQDFRIHVQCIAINTSGTKFVCQQLNSILLIFERQKNKNWIKCQTINTRCKETQICFISENEFISHNKKLDYFNIYQQQQDGQSFIQKQQSVVMKSSMFTKSTFQSKFIQEKKLFLIKHGQIIYIFNVKENGQFEEKFSLRIIAELIYGTLSDDGQFLVTWNDKQKKLEVRKLNLIQ